MNKQRYMLLPLAVILLFSAIAVTAVMASYPDTMDYYFGQGKMNVTYIDEVPPADYYEYSAEGGMTALESAQKTAQKIADSGIVLLKNNGLLPLKQNEKIAPMGYRYNYPAYMGTGSAYIDAEQNMYVSFDCALGKYFSVNENIEEVTRRASPYEISPLSIKQMVVEDYSAKKENSNIIEYNPLIYRAFEGKLADEVGLVVIGRAGDEDIAFRSQGYCDGTLHELALSSYERETIRFAKNNCKAVIAVINSSNPMQIGELLSGELECDAVIFIGAPGLRGIQSFADILVGKVNPSGRTPDIWETDLLGNPAMKNWGNFHYTNSDGMTIASNYRGAGLYFQEYAEGIYIGYRYYETASALGAIEYGATDGRGAVISQGAVSYPFGYGLSYTSFEQEIVSLKKIDKGFKVAVRVKNTGDRDGSEAVQLYYTPPYTEVDVMYGIEKSHKNLLDFQKVFLEKGEEKVVEFSIAVEDMASYCSARKNPDGSEGCYFLEKGDYSICLGKNSHESWDEEVYTQPNDIWYDGLSPRDSERTAQQSRRDYGGAQPVLAATNRFQSVTEHMQSGEITLLSRSDWLNTFPDEAKDKPMDEDAKNSAFSFDPFKDKYLGNEAEGIFSPANVAGGQVKNKLYIYDMRGMEYDDPAWDCFLDGVTLTSDEVKDMLLTHSYYTKALDDVSKPRSVDVDGPQGFSYSGAITCVYPSEVIVAATFDKTLAYEFGRSVGLEGMENKITGWYAPGLNIHRTAFGGRAFEYYSEDPILSGKIGAACVSGAADCGLVPFIKHFALSNYENYTTCMCVWATEQTLREIYFKSFEITVKEAKKTINYYHNGNMEQKTMRGCTGVMAAASMVGYEWNASSYPLITEVLRGEWGFCGTVTTDMALQVSEGIIDKALRAGCDLRMRSSEFSLLDDSSPQMLSVFRRAVKNICFTYANSNLMQGLASGAIISYQPSPWVIALIVFDGAAVLAVALIIAKIINPKLFRRKCASS